uniref:Putative carboxypeptidase b n=1 Tax=Corethrella appendiculata TaxID=1370023 RepID=U5EVJ7_9DIPT
MAACSLKFAIVLISLALISVECSKFVTYDGYKVYELKQKSTRDVEYLRSLGEQSQSNGLDFWKLSKLVNDDAVVLVEPANQKIFEQNLIENSIEFNEIISNVQNTINEERIDQRAIQFSKFFKTRSILNAYYRFDEINKYLDELSQKYSKNVQVEEVGKSFEGRTIKTIRISNGEQKADKPVIFLDAGIHAREWAAPATALYTIQQLVENSTVNSDILDNVDFIVLPVVNPDGYEYTHEKERLWRKTRSSGERCDGVDGNRNFDFHWAEVGSSHRECDEIYHGKTAFSEPETQIVREILEKYENRCKFYLTLHTYGNYLLYPWGYTSDLPETVADLDEVSQAGAAAIRKATGTKYQVGTSTNVLYAAAGGSDNYAFAVNKVPISITMELPGGGTSGFNPPPSKIEHIVTESWTGIRAMVLKVIEKYVK